MSKKSPHRYTKFNEDYDGNVTLETVQEVDPFLDENKAAYNNYGDLLTPGKQGDGVRVASIPITIWENWMKETNGAIQKDNKLLAKYLNDPNNKYFRTTPTRV